MIEGNSFYGVPLTLGIVDSKEMLTIRLDDGCETQFRVDNIVLD